MSLQAFVEQDLRSCSAPPMLESETLFAYPVEGLSQSTFSIDMKRIPSEGSLLVKKVVDNGLDDEDADNFSAAEIVKLCKDQVGCRMLQDNLTEGSQLFQNYLYSSVLPHMAELMTDPFGNYLCQVLINLSNVSQLQKIIQLVQPHLLKIALNNYGTRSVQKLIEVAHRQMCESDLVP